MVSKTMKQDSLLAYVHELATPGVPSFPNWYANDSEEHFYDNINQQPSNWYYRYVPVHYSINANGYRCPEWKDVNWSESIVIIGCSIVMGVGVDDIDTLSARLEEQLNVPVINLGTGGSSNQLMLYNSLRLIENNIKPKAVSAVFSDPGRVSIFNDVRAQPIGPWVHQKGMYRPKEEKEFYNFWTGIGNNADIHGTMSAKAVELVWKSQGVPFLGLQVYGDWCPDMGYQKLTDPIDLARDLEHGGIETQKKWARELAPLIKNIL